MFNSIFNVADQKEDNERLHHQPEQEVLHSNTVHIVYCCRKKRKGNVTHMLVLHAL